MNLVQLSKKEVKKIINQIQETFGIKNLELDYLFFKNNDNKIFILSKEVSNLDPSKFKINNLGLYIIKIEPFGFRLSIEGSQLIGKKATKNILEINDPKEWMKGNDIITDKKFKGCVLIKYKDNFLGSGFYSKEKIINFIPKSRRVRE
ncbi:hypothetical protein HYV88_02760 [Candidatus Woesearchaeota archaeon]|nr:hypothetical protein [Candidatus Woesearchaeota archaeon]